MHRSVEERRADGRARRKQLPRAEHGTWSPPADRFDPVALVEQRSVDALSPLVPIRHGRMSLSPFAFYRGTAALMAADLARLPVTGLRAQLCGDAHLTNFGGYASPDRRLVFDVNDFDETLPGPWEWDVKRLAASFVLAGAQIGLSPGEQNRMARRSVGAYRSAMREFAETNTLDTWYARLEVDKYVKGLPEEVRTRARRLTRSALDHNSLQALGKLAVEIDGEYRIRSDPPVLVPLRELDLGRSTEDVETIVATVLATYRKSLAPNRRVLLDRLHPVDVALKVVGVGSVGTRCWIVLLEGRDRDDPVFLQVKEAGRSVLEDHLPRSPYRHPGRRVVEGQQLMQASRDIFLGWTTGPEGRAYYVRQLRDGKVSVNSSRVTAAGMRVYAELCGQTLARAHARSGDAVAIAAYLGSGDAFDRAVAEFAEAYAQQAVDDHTRFMEAIDAGRLSAAMD
ncbi:MAG TPA: DUF2252 domain-containing protein [Acidimicrobiales bacterium]|jgi:uncharacterized protein (DUF2252 family)